jgi:hypothetical protein
VHGRNPCLAGRVFGFFSRLLECLPRSDEEADMQNIAGGCWQKPEKGAR